MEHTAVAWCHAFYALPLKPGARVLTCEAEYTANYVAFLLQAKRGDLGIEIVSSHASDALDSETLEQTIDDAVGLVEMTWVPMNGGLVDPEAEVGKLANANGIPYLLDACQAAG